MRRPPRGENGYVLSWADPSAVRRGDETFDLEVVHVRDGEDLLAGLRVLAPFAVLSDDNAVERRADLRSRERRPGVPELRLLLADGDEGLVNIGLGGSARFQQVPETFVLPDGVLERRAARLDLRRLARHREGDDRRVRADDVSHLEREFLDQLPRFGRDLLHPGGPDRTVVALPDLYRANFDRNHRDGCAGRTGGPVLGSGGRREDAVREKARSADEQQHPENNIQSSQYSHAYPSEPGHIFSKSFNSRGMISQKRASARRISRYFLPVRRDFRPKKGRPRREWRCGRSGWSLSLALSADVTAS